MKRPSNERRRTAHRRGFTVVEMLVAVAILGIGVSAAVACISSATRASGISEEKTAVQLLAREKLAEIELGQVSVGTSGGDFGPEREGYRWQTTARAADAPGLLFVHLTVLSGPEDAPRRTEFVTFARTGQSGRETAARGNR